MTQLEQPSLGAAPDSDPDANPEDIVAILSTPYTQSILEAIRSEPKPARALAANCDASRPTIYRRLNSLQDVGLVESSMEYDRDGHHRTVFEASFEKISVDVRGEDISVSVITGESNSTTSGSLRATSSD